MKTNRQNLLYRVVVSISTFLLFFATFSAQAYSEIKPAAQVRAETVVVSAHSDPYFELATRIAQEENLAMVEEWSDVLQFHPRYIILVAAPANLTKEMLASIGDFYKTNDYYPALGIISGSTLDAAEQLWERRKLPQAGNNFIGGDVDVLQKIDEPTIFNISDGANSKIALNKDSLIETLSYADYFYWTRHSGGTTWYWNDSSDQWSEENELHASDLPQLKPMIIYSPTCAVFRPWLKDSIALGFLDHGAAAFLGFTNSPHTSSFTKYGLFAPGITSWEEFPLGLVAQVQNKAIANMVYDTPQLYMFGDPRIHLTKAQPYQILNDVIANNGQRVIEGYAEKKGVLAIKIRDAAENNFVSIQGVTAVSTNDIFYNNRLQTLNLGADKYLLYFHQGGNFHIELSRQAPFGWVLADALTDALDYSWVDLWVNVYADSSAHIFLVTFLILIAILAYKRFKQKKSLREYRKIFLIAFIFALIRLGYCLLRLDNYTVSTNMVTYTAADMVIGLVSVFSSIAGGLVLMKDSTKIGVKSLGFLFAILRQFWMAAFYFLFLTVLNNVPQVTKMTAAGVWNYNVFWLSFVTLILESLVVLVLYRYVTLDKKHPALPG